MAVEQMEAEGLAIDAGWDPHGGEGGKAQVLGGMEFQAQALQACPEALRIAAVAGPGRF